MEDMYSPRQVASICKETLRGINKWLKDGKLTGVYDSRGCVHIDRESLRLFMISMAMDLSRLPQSAAAVAATRAVAVKAGIPIPTLVAAEKRIVALEAYVKELRTKLFYRDGYRAADRLHISDAEREKIELENIAAKRRWDVETDRQLAALAGLK